MTSLSGDHHFCSQLGTTQSDGPTTVLLPFPPQDCASISASDCCGCAQGSFRRRHLKPCESFNGPTAALYDCKRERDRCTTMFELLPTFFSLSLQKENKKKHLRIIKTKCQPSTFLQKCCAPEHTGGRGGPRGDVEMVAWPPAEGNKKCTGGGIIAFRSCGYLTRRWMARFSERPPRPLRWRSEGAVMER